MRQAVGRGEDLTVLESLNDTLYLWKINPGLEKEADALEPRMTKTHTWFLTQTWNPSNEEKASHARATQICNTNYPFKLLLKACRDLWQSLCCEKMRKPRAIMDYWTAVDWHNTNCWRPRTQVYHSVWRLVGARLQEEFCLVCLTISPIQNSQTILLLFYRLPSMYFSEAEGILSTVPVVLEVLFWQKEPTQSLWCHFSLSEQSIIISLEEADIHPRR